MTSQLENALTQIGELKYDHKADLQGAAFDDEADVLQCLADFSCKWFGPVSEILHHCQQCHSDKIWWNGEKEKKIIVRDVTKPSYRIELVVAHSHLFWLHVKNDLSAGRLYAACQQICRKDDDPLCRFMVRTELQDSSRLSCVSCSTETRPHTEDIQKIFNSQKCAARPLNRLTAFIDENNDITFTVSISKIYYYQ